VDIEDILDAVRAERVRITGHARVEAQADRLSLNEVFFSVHQGEIIEDYPNAEPFPSCLVYGNTSEGDPVHTVWALNNETGWAALITVYRPDPNRWVNWRTRREPS
jgi:hypothetical protein